MVVLRIGEPTGAPASLDSRMPSDSCEFYARRGCCLHAEAKARGGLTTVAVLTDPSPHNPELYGRMSAVAMAACDRVRERIAKRPQEAESSVGAVHCAASG